MSIFCHWAVFFLHLQVFPQTLGLEELSGQPIHGGDNKQDEKRKNIFGKMGDTGGIIQGNNSAGQCFVIRDLFPMNFQISHEHETENMYHRQNFWSNLSKVVSDTFVQYVVCNQERDRVRQKKNSEECVWSEHCNNFEKSERVYFLS